MLLDIMRWDESKKDYVVDRKPKLQPACQVQATEGMVVLSNTSKHVLDARAHVQEFLLVNHPVDCPICDQAGECKLQDYWMAHQRTGKRMRDEPVHKPKAVPFGETIVYDAERCIMCTRCIRFMEEVEGDAQIGVINRGYGSEIGTFRDEGVHSLISGNLMDVCPVGAITTKDYRFKSRPWDNPNVVDTICTQCSKGCNTNAWLKAKPEWAKGARLIRLTPRYNPDVNGYWMCDIGRFGYRWIESEQRLRTPLVRNASGQQAVPWTDAVANAAGLLSSAQSKARFLVSAHASHEELFVLRRLVDELGAAADTVTLSWRTTEKQQPASTKFKVPAVDAPNVNGGRLFGFVPGNVGDAQGPADISALRNAIESGAVSTLYVIDGGPEGSIGDTSWIVEARRSGKIQALIVQGILATDLSRAADLVLAGASFAEKDASYTNDKGVLQGASRALNTPGDAQEDWQILVKLAAGLGVTLAYGSSLEIRQDISTRLAAAAAEGMSTLSFSRPMSASTWLDASNPSERWKWEFLYQDLPPVKGAVEPSALPPAPGVIRLSEVK